MSRQTCKTFKFFKLFPCIPSQFSEHHCHLIASHPFPIAQTAPPLACPPLRDVIASNFRSLQASQVVEDRVLVILSSNRRPCDALLLRKKCEQHSKVRPKRNEKQVISQNSEIHCDQISLLKIGIGISWVGICTIYNCLTS